MFAYEYGLTYPVHVSDEKFEDCMDLLLITDRINRIMSISRILICFCAIRQNIIKNIFADVVCGICSVLGRA